MLSNKRGIPLKVLERLVLTGVVQSSLYDLSISDFLHGIRKELKKPMNDTVLMVYAGPDELDAFKQKRLYDLVTMSCKKLDIQIIFAGEEVKAGNSRRSFTTAESAKTEGEQKQ